jgi:hypothetical protein
MTLAPTLSGELLIGGDRITEASGGTHAHIYPATGQPNAHIQLAGADEIDRAVASAWDAHPEWMSLTVDRRRDVLIDLADAVHETSTSWLASMCTTTRCRSHLPTTQFCWSGCSGISPVTSTSPTAPRRRSRVPLTST